MDIEKVSPERRKILEKIKQFEIEGRFDEGVEEDPPAPVLMPDQVDYLCKKTSSKIKRKIANFLGDRFFLGQIKKGNLLLKEVKGEENLYPLKTGAMLTCNHFAPSDNYLVFHAIRKYLPHKYLYKVIREGNYTNFPGLYGFLFRHCNTIPLSSNRRTMMNMLSAVNTLLKNGESILIYPEQNLWWNYRKPRPYKIGGFKMAYHAGVPVIPTFITMEDSDRLDENGYPLQIHTLHILPPVFPDVSLGEKAGAEKMMEETFEKVKKTYEEVYQKPLRYDGE